VEGPESPESPGRLKNDLPPAEKFSLGISRTTGLVVSTHCVFANAVTYFAPGKPPNESKSPH